MNIEFSPIGLRVLAVFLAVAGAALGATALMSARSLSEPFPLIVVFLSVGDAVALGLAAVSLFEHAACAEKSKRNEGADTASKV